MDNVLGNQLQVHLRESDLSQHTIQKHDAIKKDFYGRAFYGPKGLKAAIANRVIDIKFARPHLLKTITATGINAYKQVEMFIKYRPIIPAKFRTNDLYKKPSAKIVQTVKEERKRGRR